MAIRLEKVNFLTSISRLPREMIGKIFSYLDIADIVNCADTCKEWEEIAAQLYFQPLLVQLTNYDRTQQYLLRENDWSKDCSNSELISRIFKSSIIAYYGRVFTVSSSGQTAEVIDLLSPRFKQKISFGVNESFLVGRYKWVNGFLMGDKIILHGFNYSNKSEFLCFLGQLKLGIKLNTYGREDASGIVKLNDFVLLRVGGGHRSKAIELIHLQNSEKNPFRFEKGPDFPHEIYGHAMIQFLPGKVHVIGGRIFDNTNWKATDETWIIDINNKTITAGDTLNIARSHHSVGVMECNGDYAHIIVAGGSSVDSNRPSLVTRSTTERTAEVCNNHGLWKGEWQLIYRFDHAKYWQIIEKYDRVNNFPEPDELMKANNFNILEEPIIEVPMINAPDSEGVIIVGVGNEKSNLKELRREIDNTPLKFIDYAEWINFEQDLELTKGTHVAIQIPYGFRFSTIQ